MDYSQFCQQFLKLMSAYLEHHAVVRQETVLKNNGTSWDALCFTFPGSSCSPLVYLKPLYESWKAGTELEDLGASVLEEIRKEQPFTHGLIPILTDFEQARPKIVFRLVSKKANEALLADVPWLPYLNLAVLFYIRLNSDPPMQAGVLIRNHQAKLWNVSGQELWAAAKDNTPRLLPHTILQMEKLLPFPGNLTSCLPPVYILSNTDCLYGASCLLYQGIADELADRLDSDLLLLPSSIHEFLALPDPGIEDYPRFRQIVQQINQTEVPREDFLSDELYLYSRVSHSVTVWPPLSSHDKENTAETGNP